MEQLNTSAESTSSLPEAKKDVYGNEISKLGEQEQRIYRGRLRRRKQNGTTHRIELDCNENDLQRVSLEKFCELIDKNDASSIYCFKVILNSLHEFFSSSHSCLLSTCSDCNKSVANFLSSVYLNEFAKNFIPASSTKNGKAELAYRQRELLSMLSFHLFRFFPQPFDKINISQHLRFIYFHAGSERLRNFLDSTFTDEFFLDLPFYIAAVYDDLGLLCPSDIEKYRPYENDENFIYEDEMTSTSELTNRLEEFINSVKVVEEEDIGIAKIVETATPVPKKSGNLRSLRTPATIYPQTPIKNSKPIDFPDFEGPTVIKQTPIAKMKRRNSLTSSSKFAEYWLGAESEDKNTDASTSRKRPHDSSTQLFTKKRKVNTESQPQSCFNLSILFQNFQ